MATTQWQSSFETGIKELDEQNRHFVELINQLEQHAYSAYAEAEAQDVLSKVTKASIPNFAAQERLMAENHCSFTDHHASMHQDFLAHLSVLLRRLKSDGTISVPEFLSFLKGWLINHIMREDTKLHRYGHPI